MSLIETATRRPVRVALACAALATLAACGGRERPQADLAAAQVNTIGVNSYLWRSALETFSFAPLLQADAMGGVIQVFPTRFWSEPGPHVKGGLRVASADHSGAVIITDWYANPQNPAERVKVTVTILDQDLRADALRVAASRQVTQSGTWVDAPVQAATVQKLEDIILTRARELRRQTLSS